MSTATTTIRAAVGGVRALPAVGGVRALPAVPAVPGREVRIGGRKDVKSWDRRKIVEWFRQNCQPEYGRISTLQLSESLNRPPGIDGTKVLSLAVPPIVLPFATRLRDSCSAVSIQRTYRAHRHSRVACRRRHIVSEILSSEAKYVEQLGILVDLLLTPLNAWEPQESRPMSESDARLVFSDLVVIKAVNESLLQTLRERVARSQAFQRIGDIFYGLADYLRVYTDYVKCYDQALKKVASMGQEHPFTRFFAAQIRKAPQGYWGFTLDTLLVTPIQRIPRYKLLLADLLRSTWEGHPDVLPEPEGKLHGAVRKINELAEWVNENQKRFERMDKVVELSQSVVGMDVPLVEASRQFVKEGEVTEHPFCPPGTKQSSRPKKKPRFMILFTDMIVVCDPQKKDGGKKSLSRGQTGASMKFYLRLSLDDVIVEELPDTEDEKNVFRIFHKCKREFIDLSIEERCGGAAEKARWLEAISSAAKTVVATKTQRDEHLLQLAKAKASQAAVLLEQQYKFVKYTGQTAAAASIGVVAPSSSPTRLSLQQRGSVGCESPLSPHKRASQTVTFYSMNPGEKLELARKAEEELQKLRNLDRLAEAMQQRRAVDRAERSKAALQKRYAELANRNSCSAGTPSSCTSPRSGSSTALAQAVADMTGEMPKHRPTWSSTTVPAVDPETEDAAKRTSFRERAKPQRFSFGKRVVDDPLTALPNAAVPCDPREAKASLSSLMVRTPMDTQQSGTASGVTESSSSVASSSAHHHHHRSSGDPSSGRHHHGRHSGKSPRSPPVDLAKDPQQPSTP